VFGAARGDASSRSQGPVLGIDPGLTRCGFGVVARDGSTLVAVGFGVISTDPAAPVPERLATLEREVRALLVEVRPSAVAVERLLFQHNVRTAVAVGQASGVVLACVAGAEVPVTHYSPNEIKLAVTGSGTADKSQVQAMVTRLLHLETLPSPFDAADALALAVCHAWSAPLRAATASEPARPTPRLQRAVEQAIAREAAS
jgi:crossover junction endodeoxyribonuclease RuvC